MYYGSGHKPDRYYYNAEKITVKDTKHVKIYFLLLTSEWPTYRCEKSKEVVIRA